MSAVIFAEYIWLDGSVPVRQLRSKTKCIGYKDDLVIEDFPQWGFDGSSTNQAEGNFSDCVLKPVNFIPDPTRGGDAYLVMCEVLNADGSIHPSNSRAQLREVLESGAGAENPWVGFEQEYTIFKGNSPLGWPEQGYPAPQGPYYCGVGSRQIFGRDFVEEHAAICSDAGIVFSGINAEVMPGQWEFQVGYRGIDSEDNSALNICDHLWFARWLLHRVSEEYGYHISIDNKPVKGDWNGAGLHTNFSNDATRNKTTGMQAIKAAAEALSHKHEKHITLYGDGNDERLTGDHETASIDDFSAGVSDRGSSIRIPQGVNEKGYGYFEDRRPGANADPYLVAARLCATVGGIDESVMKFTSWPRKK